MKTIHLFVLIACMTWQSCSSQEESETRPVAARGLLKRGPLAKGKTTTTTTSATIEDVDESDYADSDTLYSDQDQSEASSSQPPSTTEGKKLVPGGVRPFRSNTDLLETLKRRRAQAAEAKLNGLSNSSPNTRQDNAPVEPPVKATYTSSKRRPSTSQKKEPANDEANVTAKASGIRGRFTKPSSKLTPEVEQPEQEVPAGRTGRTFRRGGN